MNVSKPARAGIGALTALLLVCAPSVAAGHGLLKSSLPAGGSTVAQPPAELVLTFTERPEPRFTGVRLFGPRGEVPLDSLRVLPGMTVAAPIRAPLPNGLYRVEWITAGLDGHPVSGNFSFVVAAPASAGVDSQETGDDTSVAAPSVSGADSMTGTNPTTLATLLRWLTLVGTLGVIGAVAFRVIVLARVSLEIDREIVTDYLPRAVRNAARFGIVTSIVLLGGALGRLVVQSQVIHGNESALDGGLVRSMLVETAWGRGWIVHFLAATAALVAFVVLARRPRWGMWLVAAAASLAVAFSLASVSHAAALAELSTISVLANAVHVVAAAGWLGTLLVIFVVGLPLAMRLDRADRWTVVRDIVNAFSPAAIAFAATAVATGVLMTWTHLRSLDNLFGSDYGRVLLLKLALLAVTAVVGAYNWRRIRPSLRDHTAVARLRGSTALELTVAGLVVAVTSVLIALPLPTE